MTAKKIIVSLVSGLFVLAVSWKYQNYDYSLSVEDNFMKKMFMMKEYIYSTPSKQKADFVFINTGKDLALVEDTVEYGNVAVSDREKIYRLIAHINNLPRQPVFTVLDIQFYYPYTKDPRVDGLLQKELSRNEKIVIPILKIDGDYYKKPLYKARYAYSNYRTFGSTFNKFRIMNEEEYASIPLILHQDINHAMYKDHFFFPTCNGRLCLSALWPNYYLKNEDITGLNYHADIKGIKNDPPPKQQENVTAQYYNLGEMLLDMDADSTKYNNFFSNKIVIAGNFEEDVHTTPVGKMAGPVLLANLYLSLLNGQQIAGAWLIIVLLLAFSGLSYIAWFSKIPELKLNFKFLFSSYLIKFIKGYISYFGSMFFLSLIVLMIFDVHVALFMPSFIFTGIEYIRQKRYKSIGTSTEHVTTDEV